MFKWIYSFIKSQIYSEQVNIFYQHFHKRGEKFQILRYTPTLIPEHQNICLLKGNDLLGCKEFEEPIFQKPLK